MKTSVLSFLLPLIFIINALTNFFSLLKLSEATYNSFLYPQNYNQIELPNVNGPESFAFDCHGEGPYASVSDGRILKWEGPNLGWKEFATISPSRPRSMCDGSTNPDDEPTCGRPLGLKFHRKTCDLYIADAYFGLLMVGPTGGVAHQVATSAEGISLGFANALDIDNQTGAIYFTDSSTVYQRRVWLLSILTGDATGRLIRYDPGTKKTTVLLKGLAFPDGVALSDDNSFLLLAETTTMKIFKVWLKGPKAHTSEVFAQLGRSPDNIKRNRNGEFWIALNTGRAVLRNLFHHKFSNQVVLPPWTGDPVAVKFDGEGNVVAAVDGNGESTLESVSEVEEYDGSLWLGSAVKPYVGVMRHIDK